MVKTVIVCDAVGTLIRPTRSVSQTYASIGREYGSRLEAEQISQRFGPLFQKYFRSGQATNEAIEKQRWRKLVAELFAELDQTDALFDSLWKYFAAPESWQIFDDTTPFLLDLHSRNLPVLIASNFDDRLTRIVASLRGLETIHSVVVSSEIGWPKPCRQFFESIETRMPAEQYWMIGDDPICDIEEAVRRGWNAVLIDRRDRHPEMERRVASLLELSIPG